MVNTVWVKADHGRGNFTNEENRDFSAIVFSFQLMLEQALTNLIICVMIPHKNYIQRCTD